MAGIVHIVLIVMDHPAKVISTALFTALMYLTPAVIILRTTLGIDIKFGSTRRGALDDESVIFAAHHTTDQRTGFSCQVASMPFREEPTVNTCR
jgi:hypothetical protein